MLECFLLLFPDFWQAFPGIASIQQHWPVSLWTGSNQIIVDEHHFEKYYLNNGVELARLPADPPGC